MALIQVHFILFNLFYLSPKLLQWNQPLLQQYSMQLHIRSKYRIPTDILFLAAQWRSPRYEFELNIYF